MVIERAELRRLVTRPWGRVVGIASVIIVAPNDSRKKITFTNGSANAMWISPGTLAAVGVGHYLAVNGTAGDERDRFGYIYTGPYAAIALGAGSQLGIVEE